MQRKQNQYSGVWNGRMERWKTGRVGLEPSPIICSLCEGKVHAKKKKEGHRAQRSVNKQPVFLYRLYIKLCGLCGKQKNFTQRKVRSAKRERRLEGLKNGKMPVPLVVRLSRVEAIGRKRQEEWKIGKMEKWGLSNCC
jgi:hypothetical protein